MQSEDYLVNPQLQLLQRIWGLLIHQKLIELLIKVGSMEGGTVLDPFCGTGTTGNVAGMATGSED